MIDKQKVLGELYFCFFRGLSIYTHFHITHNIMSSNPDSSSEKTVAIGMDVGSWNARLASWDESLSHSVMIANHDGHRTTRVSNDNLEVFLKDNLMALAASSAHTKNLNIVLSVDQDDDIQKEKLPVLQKFGAVITDAAATCLAYEDLLMDKNLQQGQSILVLDGGARGIKATLLECKGNNTSEDAASDGLPLLAHTSSQLLKEVNGNEIIDALAQSVAQQFEQKNRFPRGEVWESKKVKEKLRRHCEAGLKTLVINNTVTIHVDGLYEGVDCQVTISKPKWDHLSSAMATKVKTFLKTLPEPDVVLIAGNMHPWLQPHAKTVFGNKIVNPTSFDPAEAVALGCAKQAFVNLTASEDDGVTLDKNPTMKVSVSPVSIGIKSIKTEESKEEQAEESLTMIPIGTPLPALVTRDFQGAVSMDLWQLEPQEKQLASFTELDESTTLKLHLSEQGKLKIWLNNETLAI